MSLEKGRDIGTCSENKKIIADCDNDTLLIYVDQTGPACHTGSHSCFFNEVWES